MKTMTKIALVGASLLSMGALTACQSTQSVQDKGADHPRKMMGDKHDRRMTPEQLERKQKLREQRQAERQGILEACKTQTLGQPLEFKFDDRTVQGQCHLVFQADKDQLKKWRSTQAQFKDGREHRREFKRGEKLTEEQRAEKQKLREQVKAERDAQRQAITTACQGKSHGQNLQIKLGEQSINGQCQVRFKPMPIAQKPVKK